MTPQDQPPVPQHGTPSQLNKFFRHVSSRRDVRPRECGIAVVYATLTMLFLIPFIGLSVDAGVAYVIKTRLSIAVDSACLAAARSLSRGLTLAAQEASARATALRYFYANFPAGDWRTTGEDPVVLIEETGTRMRTATVSAVRTAPLYFLPLIGEHYADVGVVGQASRRDSNIILVLDRSQSMADSNSVQPMKNAAVNFAQQFANGKDRMGLVVFNMAVSEAMQPTMHFLSSNPSITARINSIVADGGTNATGALNAAYRMLLDINEPGAVNAIVFFTDGYPSALTANFNNRRENGELDLIKASSGCHNKNSDRIGAIAFGGSPKATTPSRWGIYQYSRSSIEERGTNGGFPIDNLNGCAMRNNNNAMGDDIARMPYRDLWGNLTSGVLGGYTVTHTTLTNPMMSNAIRNTVLDQAQKIRSNASLRPVIYAIGLSVESGDMALDEVFMKNIANTEDSTRYNPDQAAGLYIFVPANGQQSTGLQEAFQRIASEILRLSL
jgi:hypothetical protein